MPSTRIMRYAVVAVLVLLAGCATQPETDLDRYKVQFDYAASQLEVRKQETFQALQALEPLQEEVLDSSLRAQIASNVPLTDDQLIYVNEQAARRYLDGWAQARLRADRLSEQFGEVNDIGLRYFEYLRQRARTNITGQDLQERMVEYINQNQTIFEERFSEASQGLGELDGLISQGNDIAEAIRIAGSVKVLGAELHPIEIDEVLDLLAMIENRIENGTRVLETELSEGIAS